MNLIYLSSIFLMSLGISLTPDTIKPEESKVKMVLMVRGPVNLVENHNENEQCYDLSVFNYINREKLGNVVQCYTFDTDSRLIFIHQEINLINGHLEIDFTASMENIDSDFTSYTHKITSLESDFSRVIGTGIFSEQLDTVQYLGMISIPETQKPIANVNGVISIYME